MAGMTNYLGNTILTNFVTAGNRYLALHTADPGASGSPSGEHSGGGYTRALIQWSIASNRSTANTNSFQYLNLNAATLTHLAIWDAQTGGNCLYSIALPAPIIVIDGQYLTFPVSDIAVVLN